MIARSVEIDFTMLRDALEKSKNLKCDIIAIPSKVGLDLEHSFFGIYGNSIYTRAEFLDYTETQPIIIPINTLSRIYLWTKDISVFFRSMDALGVDKNRVILDVEDIVVNDMIITNGLRIRSMSTSDGQYSVLPLIDGRDMYNRSRVIMGEYHFNTEMVLDYIDISKDEEFLNIMTSKTAIGAQLWVPYQLKNKEKWDGHVLTLANNFLNVSKGDSVYLSIKDDLTNRIPHSFITNFTIIKKKKKCILQTYMWNLKMY